MEQKLEPSATMFVCASGYLRGNP